jgi:intracellular sulfur oxidation DsrE/DsrF family protein
MNKRDRGDSVAVRKLLIHISDRDKWLSVLNQVARLMEESDKDDLEIVIIADVFAGAGCIACNKPLEQQMRNFVEADQKLLVCEESLRCLRIPLKSLPDFIQTVPNGLSEIIKRQSEGFHYVKG